MSIGDRSDPISAERDLQGSNSTSNRLQPVNTMSSSAEPEQAKPTRVLACALCKQRRVKCSRSFPCTNCVRAGVACVQPTVNQRRRRFAERGLLDRLHQYEDILKQNSIAFEPLHVSTPNTLAHDDDEVSPATAARRNKDKEAMYVHHGSLMSALEPES